MKGALKRQNMYFLLLLQIACINKHKQYCTYNYSVPAKKFEAVSLEKGNKEFNS